MERASWSAPEFHYYEKSSLWFIVSAVIAAILIIVALAQGNLLFGIFVVIAELMVLFWGRIPPKTVKYVLTDEGVEIVGVKKWKYSDFNGYALVEELGGPDYYELILRPTVTLSTYTKFLVPNADAKKLEKVLEEKVAKMEYQEPLSERLMKFLGL